METKNIPAVDGRELLTPQDHIWLQPGRLLPSAAPDGFGKPDGFDKTPPSGLFGAARARLTSVVRALSPNAQPVAVDHGSVTKLYAPGATYALSQEQAHGYFGSFRLATDSRHGYHLGVKQLHYHHDDVPAQPVPGAPHVHSQKRSAILDELHVQSQVGALKPVAVVEADSQVFVVMNLMQGDLLDVTALLTEQERLPVSWSIFAQTASNLAICHRAAFVHCDVKLENILWDERGSVVMTDYGLAVASDDVVTLGRQRGRIFSLPPEALAGQVCDEKLDVWLFATTMLHALAPSHRPFQTGFVWDAPQSEQARKQAKIEYTRARVASFLAARTAYLAGEAVQDASWAAPFAEGQKNNLTMFRFLLGHMFDPEPTTRIDMKSIAAFALQHFHGMPEDDKRTCVQAFARLGRVKHAKHGEILRWLMRHFDRPQTLDTHQSANASQG